MASKKRSFTRRQVVSLGATGVTFSVAGCSALSSGSSDDHYTDTTESQPKDESGGVTHGHGSESAEGHSHGGGLGPATKTAAVRMLTTGSLTDVFTGKTDPVSFVMNNRTHFEPHVVHIEPGGTVTWTNESGEHGVAAYHPANDRQRRIPTNAKAWSSGQLGHGETFSYTFTVEGIYDYYCPPHEGMGMIGSVVVGNPPVENQPGLQPPEGMVTSKATTKIEQLNQRVRQALTTGPRSDSGHEHESGSGNDTTTMDGHETTTTDEHGSGSDGHDHGHGGGH